MLHRSGPLVLFLLFTGSHHLTAQQQAAAENPPPPAATIRTQARLVLLDVVVADGHGHPIKGLKQSDFTLYEDGVPQKLASFRERNAPDAAPVSVEPKLPSNTFINHAPIADDRTMTVLLFDHLAFADEAYLRSQMLSFIKTLKPGTPICIFRLDPELRLVQDFTTDPQVLHDAIVSKRNQFRFETPYQRFTQTTNSMLELARYLSGFPGRKNLIWFSRGLAQNTLDGYFPNITTFTQDLTGITDTLTLSRVVLYPVDARGLVVDPRAGFEILSEDGELADAAQQTGGRAFYSTNGFKQAVEEIVSTGSNYYTLSYSPTDPKWDGSYRKIKIAVSSNAAKNGPLQKVSDYLTGAVRLEYRRGYYARDGKVVTTPDSPKRTVLNTYTPGPNSRHHAKEIPMDAAMLLGAVAPFQVVFAAQVTPADTVEKIKRNSPRPYGNFLAPQWRNAPYRNYRIHYSIDPRDIQFASVRVGSYHDTIQFIALIYSDDGVITNSIVTTVPFKVDAAGYGRIMQDGLAYDQTIAIPTSGNFFLRAGIHDFVSGHIGALEVPSESIKRLPATNVQRASKP